MKKEGSGEPIINETKKWSSSLVLEKEKVQRERRRTLNEKRRKRNFSDDLHATEKGITLMNRENLERNKFDEGRERKKKKNVKEGKCKCDKNKAGFRYNK